MPATVTEHNEGRLVAVNVRGKLTRADYDRFVPVIERLIERHGKISFLVKFEGFTGIEAGALWEDVKFDLKHFNDIERLGVVGQKAWMEWMAAFCKPFTSGEVRYFPPERYDEALDWASHVALKQE